MTKFISQKSSPWFFGVMPLQKQFVSNDFPIWGDQKGSLFFLFQYVKFQLVLMQSAEKLILLKVTLSHASSSIYSSGNTF
jgi:hypothetical protein